MTDNILTEAFKERLKNKPVSAFIFSFLVWNWKLTLTFIDVTSSFKNRINYIETELLPITKEMWLVPIIATAVYIFIIPLISHVVYLYQSWLTNKKEIRDQKHKNYLNALSLEIEDIFGTLSNLNNSMKSPQFKSDAASTKELNDAQRVVQKIVLELKERGIEQRGTKSLEDLIKKYKKKQNTKA